MALADYIPESRPVLFKGKTLTTVEGLSFDGLAELVKTHMPDFEQMFELVERGETPNETFSDHLKRVARNIVLQAPELAAQIIAVASTEKTDDRLVAAARRLPFDAQIQALMVIGELTFEEEGGIKKALESTMSLLLRLRTKGLQGMTKAMQSATPPS